MANRNNPIPEKARDILYLIGGLLGIIGGPSTGILLSSLGYEEAAVPTLIAVSIIGGMVAFLAKANVGEKGIDGEILELTPIDDANDAPTESIQDFKDRMNQMSEAIRKQNS